MASLPDSACVVVIRMMAGNVSPSLRGIGRSSVTSSPFVSASATTRPGQLVGRLVRVEDARGASDDLRSAPAEHLAQRLVAPDDAALLDDGDPGRRCAQDGRESLLRRPERTLGLPLSRDVLDDGEQGDLVVDAHGDGDDPGVELPAVFADEGRPRSRRGPRSRVVLGSGRRRGRRTRRPGRGCARTDRSARPHRSRRCGPWPRLYQPMTRFAARVEHEEPEARWGSGPGSR